MLLYSDDLQCKCTSCSLKFRQIHPIDLTSTGDIRLMIYLLESWWARLSETKNFQKVFNTVVTEKKALLFVEHESKNNDLH